MDNSSVLCNILVLGNPFIYNKYRMFPHHFVLFRLYLQTPQATQSRHPTCVVIHGDFNDMFTVSCQNEIGSVGRGFFLFRNRYYTD